MANADQACDIESLLSLCKMLIELLNARFPTGPGAETPVKLKELTDFVKTAEAKILRMVGFVGMKPTCVRTSFLQKFVSMTVESGPRTSGFAITGTAHVGAGR